MFTWPAICRWSMTNKSNKQASRLAGWQSAFNRRERNSYLYYSFLFIIYIYIYTLFTNCFRYIDVFTFRFFIKKLFENHNFYLLLYHIYSFAFGIAALKMQLLPLRPSRPWRHRSRLVLHCYCHRLFTTSSRCIGGRRWRKRWKFAEESDVAMASFLAVVH